MGEFISTLQRHLSDETLLRQLSESTVLVLGPSGMWLFKVLGWSGTITRQEDLWTEAAVEHAAFRRKKVTQQVHTPAPDEQWQAWRAELIKSLSNRLPGQTWTPEQVQGGIVFAHPQAKPDKERIQGNSAAYGVPTAWVGRINRASAVEGCTLEANLQVLDCLQESGEQAPASARSEAERLYLQAVEDLQLYLTKVVK